MKEPNHEIFPCRDGGWTLKDLRNGQTMHSEIGPWREAWEIFIQPSRIEERARRIGGPLVIADVGLGMAANALCALASWRLVPGPKRPLKLVSYETDPSGLERALAVGPGFLDAFRTETRALLKDGCWESDDVVWELRTDDFTRARLGGPELVFFDLYAPKTQPELWTRPVFEHLRAEMDLHGLFLTYSAAGHVRRALAEAGFHVGRGPGTVLKRESTHASTELEELAEPFGKRYHFSHESMHEAASIHSRGSAPS